MKIYIFAILIGIAQTSLAQVDTLTQNITCSDDTYTITIDVDQEAGPLKTEYRIYKGNKPVRKGSFNEVLQGYEGTFLNAFVWEFSNLSDSIGIATQDFKEIQEGIWSGKADVEFSTDDGQFSARTIDCQIEVH